MLLRLLFYRGVAPMSPDDEARHWYDPAKA